MIGPVQFHIYQDGKGEWRWRLIASNGRITADSSEGYVSKSNVERAVDALVVDIALLSGKQHVEWYLP